MKKFRITIGGKSYEVSADRGTEPGKLQIVVDGKEHIVDIEEEQEAPRSAGPAPRRPAAPRPAPRAAAGAGGKIVSPLPGVVLSIDVKEGQTVSAGDRLMVLEAMKMENIISADTSGTVQNIHVSKGEKVETGQKLMEIE